MNIMKKLTAIFLALIIVLSLTGCGTEKKLLGTWKLTGGSGLDDFLGNELYGYSLEDLGFEMSYEFKKDGTCNWIITMMDITETVKGTWKLSGEKLKMNFNGDAVNSRFKLEGNKLIFIEIDGPDTGDLIFEKAD